MHIQPNLEVNESEAMLRDFFEEAYWLQRGEFFPEIHLKNIDELCRAFPWDKVVVDALYRILPHFDYIAQEAVKRFRAGEFTSEEAFQQLCFPVFHYIPEQVKRSAWDIHLTEQYP
jgi:hypothetical protein